MNEKMPEKIEDKLFSVKYKTDAHCHLQPDESKCLQCLEKTCTIVCPANVYLQCLEKTCTIVCPANVYCYNETEKKLVVSYEKCLECGACRIACKHLKWEYPKSGKGVQFKKG